MKLIDLARRVDPLGPLMAAAALVIFLAQGFDSILTRDLALYSYGAQQTVEGVPPYVSVLNRAGPLAHLVPAIGVAFARAVGMDDVLAMRLLMMLISLACVWLLYLLSRDLFGSRLAGVASSSALLTFTGFVTYAVGGPREKTTLTLFVILVFWAANRPVRNDGCQVSVARATKTPASSQRCLSTAQNTRITNSVRVVFSRGPPTA